MSALTATDLGELAGWRQALHAMPEISGEERETARRVREALEPLSPARVIERLGGWGVAALFAGAGPGPCVLVRAELDALPIEERGAAAHRSRIPGRAHLCGHDGHMATLLGLARRLSRSPPRCGRVWLLFQPAEETGAGAAAVIADPRYRAEIAPDHAFALHNLPGVPLGEAIVPVGPANCASAGLLIRLRGRTAYAGSPETGLAPTPALAALLSRLNDLGTPARPDGSLPDAFAMCTVTHARLGEPAFGIAPGEAEVFATLRTLRDGEMAALRGEVETLARSLAGAHGLELSLEDHEVFRACLNHPEAAAILRDAASETGLRWHAGPPLRASEDFGRFGEGARSAMLFLGAGTAHPALHDPNYDFPDALIVTGAQILERAVRRLTD
ncbi:amidohydrolase [Aureimonas sp. AU4]|uniref:amidohydrolase n=1 Tax=Aureimonas sp. AU4 TaxID=1638163 RepID=UPI000A932885|nr:amidohydrolase [Aureimonas sp. AU4]